MIRSETGLNVPTLIELFALRASGVPIFYLAKRCNRDRHTVRTYLNAHNIPILSMDLRTVKKKKVKYVYLDDEHLCPGKTYKEYIEEARQREWTRRLQAVGIA